MEVSVLVFMCVLFAIIFATLCYCCLRFYSSELKVEERIEPNSNRSSTRLQNRRLTTPRSRRLPKGASIEGASSNERQPVLPALDIYMRRTAPYPVTTCPYPPEPPQLGFGYPEVEQIGWSTYPYFHAVEPPYPLTNMPHPRNSDTNEVFCPIETNGYLPESVIIINETGRSGTPVRPLYPPSIAHPLSTAQMPSTSHLAQRPNMRSSDSPPPSYAEAIHGGYLPTSYPSNGEFTEYKPYR